MCLHCLGMVSKASQSGLQALEVALPGVMHTWDPLLTRHKLQVLLLVPQPAPFSPKTMLFLCLLGKKTFLFFPSLLKLVPRYSTFQIT